LKKESLAHIEFPIKTKFGQIEFSEGKLLFVSAKFLDPENLVNKKNIVGYVLKPVLQNDLENL